MVSGLLHVTMAPRESLTESDFHYWYNNEHGPTRLRLPFITTGLRYARHSTSDASSPPWIALYDISDMSYLQSEDYLRLRSPPVKSQREIDVMKQIDVVRNLFESVGDEAGKNLEQHKDALLVEVLLELRNNEQIETQTAQVLGEIKALPNWEHVQGFRSEHQVVVLCSVQSANLDKNKLRLESLLTSMESNDLVAAKTIRIWEPYYKFGPAPRHLSQKGETWVHYGTRTIPGNKSAIGIPAVESYALLPDKLKIPFRLEGSTDANAPVIVLVNSVMVHWDIWDEFVAAFFADKNNSKYRVLRFLPRGRFRLTVDPASAEQSVTVDQLANDIVELLKALRINKADCVMGVSLGGATALRAALLYPDIFGSFVSCDTNASSPAGNAKAWGERIEIAEKEGAAVATRDGMEEIIGENLAEVTVRRWAVPESYDDTGLQKTLQRVKDGVKLSSLQGFKQQVQALYKYDFWKDMETANTKGIFVVGAGDGSLPAGMKKMAEKYGTGSTLHIVEKAGHLPMVERPKEVAQILTDFLKI